MSKFAKLYVKLCRLLFSVAALCLFASASSESLKSVADIVIVNARIYPVNARRPWADAIAIRGDKILAVSSAKEIAGYRGASTKIIDAKGKLVLPGFTDCHIHFMDGSLGAGASLEPGKLADLIVLSQDLVKIEPNQVAKTEVLLTMVGGKVVYQAPTWPTAAEVK